MERRNRNIGEMSVRRTKIGRERERERELEERKGSNGGH